MALVPSSSNHQLIAVPIKSLTTTNKIQFSTTASVATLPALPTLTNVNTSVATNLSTNIKTLPRLKTIPTAGLKLPSNLIAIKKNDNVSSNPDEVKATYLICSKNNLINDKTKEDKQTRTTELSKSIFYQLNSQLNKSSLTLPINQIINQTVNQSFNQSSSHNSFEHKIDQESTNSIVDLNKMEVEYPQINSNKKLEPIIEEEINDLKDVDLAKDESNQSNYSNKSMQDEQFNKNDDYLDDLEMLSSPASDFDPVEILIWDNGVGHLPGSNVQFKLNEYGILEFITDKEAEELKRSTSSSKYYSDDYLASNGNSKTAHTTDDLYATCTTCGTKKLKSSFIRKGLFCSQTCATFQSSQLRNLKKNSINSHFNGKFNSFNKIDNYKKQLRNRKTAFNHQDLYDQDSKHHSNGTEIEDVKTKVQENYKQDKYFSWKKYLIETRSTAAPLKCFKPNQLFNSKQNPFRPNMKLEAIDPLHPSLFCVATVAEVRGYRLRVHLDKYSSQFDFWLNCDSPFIFHVGFCAKTNRKLQPPKNYDQFEWNSYLQQEKAKAAPKHCFYWHNKQLNQPSGFKVGMKLEAVDKANQSLTCVATINDILGDWLLIHFDGWDNSYDYWCEYNSPFLHPINFCKSKGKPLTAPKDYPKSNDKFNWTEYLEKTKSICVASDAFRVRPANLFKASMKLEVVDRRNPRYIRVATIISRNSYSVKINFDNWNDQYDFWIDDDSPDLHPVNWCYQTNDYIEEPPSYDYDSSSYYNRCVIFGCKGIGHIRNPNMQDHETIEDCPYSSENIDYEVQDRFGTSSDLSSSDNYYMNESESNLNSNVPSPNSNSIDSASLLDKVNQYKSKYNSNYQFESDFYNNSDSERFSRSSSPNSPNSDLNQVPLKLSMVDIKSSFLQFEEPLLHWDKHTKHLIKHINSLNCEEVLEWSCDKVVDFVSKLPGCQEYAAKFQDENIDGEAFLLLTQADLIKILNIKLGPAIKVYNSILLIRRNICPSSKN